MKKLLLIPVLGLVFAGGMSSCSKCQVCKKPSEPETRICKGDYNTETEYGFAIDLKESQGFECKSSI